MNKKSTIKKTIVAFAMIGLSFFSFGQTIFSENFEGSLNPGTQLPDGWSETGLSDDGIYMVGTEVDADAGGFWPVPAHTKFAMSNDDVCDCDKSADRLILPVQDLSSYSGAARMFFSANADNQYGGIFTVEVSTDGGNNWTVISTLPTTNATYEWQDLDVNLTPYLGQSNVLISFLYNDEGEWALGLAIDDVSIIVQDPTTDLAITSISDLSTYLYTPISQTNGFNVSAVVSNVGDMTVSNYSVISEIYLDPDYDNPVQTFTFNGTNLAVGSNFTVNQGTYTPGVEGFYVAYTYVVADGDDNDLNDWQLNFTQYSTNEFARYDIDGTLSNFGIGAGAQGVIGSTIDIVNETNLDTVAFFSRNSVAGGTMQVKVFPFQGASPSLTAIGQSAVINITQALVDAIATDGFGYFAMPITNMSGNPLTLSPGKYLVGIEESADAESIALFHSDAIFTPGEFFVSLNGDAFAQTQTFGAQFARAPLISSFVTPGNILPTITSNDSDNSICIGEAITLTSSMPTGNQWNFNGAPIAGQTSNVLVVTEAGNYSVTVDGQTSAMTMITVNSLPTVNAGADVNVCAGNTVTLNANGASTYVWSNGIPNGATFTPSSTTTLTVTGTDANGCSNTDDLMITVVDNVTISLVGTTSPSSCGQSDATITVDLGANSGNLFLFGPVNSSLANVTGVQTFQDLATGSYSVTLTTGDGCNSNILAVSISDDGVEIPTITIEGTTTFCAGGSVTLTSSATGGNVWSTNSFDQSITVTSSGSYSVTTIDVNLCVATSEPVIVTVNNNPTISQVMISNPTSCGGTDGSITIQTSTNGTLMYNTSSMNVIASPTTIPNLSAGTYDISLTSAANCPSNTLSVTLADPNAVTPTITVVGNTTFCAGGSVTLTSSLSDAYMWSNNATTQSITVNTAGTYSVSATNAGCSVSSEEITVIVNALPIVSAGEDQSVCLGESVTLTGSGALTYQWTGGITNGVAFTPTTSQTYTVTGTDVNGCSNTDQVSVGAILDIINAGGDVAICIGASATLTATNGTNHTWNQGLGAGISHTVSPTTTTTYTLSGIGIAGCPATDDVTVIVNQLPNINAGVDQTVCINSSVTLTASGGLSYVWDNGVANNQSFTATETTTYTVTGTDVNGCVNTDMVTVTVDSCLSINENNIVALKVYPNPSTGLVTISADDFKGFTNVTVLDQVGRKVINTVEINSTTVVLNLTDLANGTYLIELSGASTKIVQVQLNK
jgi:trimeric autotransporter adhesin